MNSDFDDKVRAISDWMIGAALTAEDYSAIYAGYCERLRNAGIPVERINISMRTLHPMAEAISLIWCRGDPIEITFHPHGVGETDTWRLSPLKAMLDAEQQEIRFHGKSLEDGIKSYPLLAELAAEGLTDYHAFAITFSDERAPFENRDGLLATYATTAPGGFQPDQIQALRQLMPCFSLVAKLANRERLFSNILDAYLGPDAGDHVRNGQIALGSGQVIDAVIWFSDLRNSTPLAEELGHAAFLDLLNDYFAALAGAVLDHRGQVLRFIGDAALSIFPIGENGFLPSEARSQAEKAARHAMARAEEINATRRSVGKRPFDFGIGLHVGRIMYGNIGVPARVEFSVVGAAANEAARLEALCKPLGEPVLASEAFVQHCETEWRPLGPQTLRGSKKPQNVFAL